jgi:hypothetical protein
MYHRIRVSLMCLFDPELHWVQWESYPVVHGIISVNCVCFILSYTGFSETRILSYMVLFRLIV